MKQKYDIQTYLLNKNVHNYYTLSLSSFIFDTISLKLN
jgi:hypothetical protein